MKTLKKIGFAIFALIAIEMVLSCANNASGSEDSENLIVVYSNRGTESENTSGYLAYKFYGGKNFLISAKTTAANSNSVNVTKVFDWYKGTYEGSPLANGNIAMTVTHQFETDSASQEAIDSATSATTINVTGQWVPFTNPGATMTLEINDGKILSHVGIWFNKE